jgi:hypothetical protein
MTAAEIRQKGIPSPSDVYGGDATAGTDRGVAENLGFAVGALREIAAQLAELNEKLTPARLVKAIAEIQSGVEELDRKRKDSGGGPP